MSRIFKVWDDHFGSEESATEVHADDAEGAAHDFVRDRHSEDDALYKHDIYVRDTAGVRTKWYVKFEPPFSVQVMQEHDPEEPDPFGSPQPSGPDLGTKASMPALTPKQAAEARWAALSAEDAWAMLENQPRIAGPWEVRLTYMQRWDTGHQSSYAQAFQLPEDNGKGWRWIAFYTHGRSTTKLDAMRAADASLRDQNIMVVGAPPEDP